MSNNPVNRSDPTGQYFEGAGAYGGSNPNGGNHTTVGGAQQSAPGGTSVAIYVPAVPTAASAPLSQGGAGERIPGTVYVTGHQVGGVGPYHLAIEGRFGDADPVTLSAQRTDGLLRSVIDRSSDTPANNITIGAITPPEGFSPRDYFSQLRAADAAYCDCLDYDLDDNYDYDSLVGNNVSE